MTVIHDPFFYLMAVPAILIAGVSKGGFGGGLGVVAVPLLTLAVSPVQAAAVMLPILCFMDLFGVWAYRGKWDRANLRIMLPASIVGIVIGALLFRHLTAAHIRLIVGVIAVGFTLRYWLGASGRTPEPRPRSWLRGGFWSATAGFTSFVSHAGGPPVGVYLLPQRLDKTVYQATTVIFFITVNYVKLVPYTLLGQFTPGNLGTSLVLLPLAFAGMALGIWLHHRVSERRFFQVCYVLLFLTGLKLLYDGLSSLGSL